jgi:hypothetical protein
MAYCALYRIGQAISGFAVPVIMMEDLALLTGSTLKTLQQHKASILIIYGL